MIALEDARQRVIAACPHMPVTDALIADAIGLVCAETVVAREPIPGFANSAMDGFALHSTDVRSGGSELSVVASRMAGDGAPVEVGRMQAVRIMTGAALPGGTDAVCPVENARVSPGGTSVLIVPKMESGANVRLPGEDVEIGDAVIRAGTVITPAHLGVLASLGVPILRVIPVPRVGVLSVGDELQEGSAPLGCAMLRDANRPALIAQLATDGFRSVDLGIVPDDEDVLMDALRGAFERCDAVITSAGVSVGDRDIVLAVFEKISAGAAQSMQIAIKPAKPFAFGLDAESGTPMFGLPGNPVAALVSYEVLTRAVLRSMSGHSELDRPLVAATATEAISRKQDGKLHLVRVIATYGSTGRLSVAPVTGQGSHMLAATSTSNALAYLPDGEGVVPGDDLFIRVFGELRYRH